MSRPLAYGGGGTLCVLLLLLLLLLLRPLLRLRPPLRLKLRLLPRLLLLLRLRRPAELWPVAVAARLVRPHLIVVPELLLGHLVVHHLLMHLVLHHLVVLPLLLLLLVVWGLEALVRVVGAVAVEEMEGVPTRVRLALVLWLWLWLQCTAWRVVPADPAAVAWALALRREVALQPQRALGVRLLLARARRCHRVRLKGASSLP